MNKRVTIKDLAKYTGFSTTTVSLVLNNNASTIPDAAKKKIIDAAKELNYVPNLSARSLVRGSTKTIGILIPDISNTFFSTLVHDIQIELSKFNYDIILCNSDGKLENDIHFIHLLSSRGVDGIILSLSAESMEIENQDIIKQVLDTTFVPFIFLDRYFNYDAHKVIVDNHIAGYEVAKLLHEYGHKNIGIITGPKSLNSSQNRYSGYMDYYKDEHIQFDETCIYIGNYDCESGYNGAKELLKKPITAIFAFNDLQAYGVLAYCKDHNIDVPQDLSIVGFDNLEISNIITPKLTTIAQPTSALGRSAASCIIALIENKECEKEIKLPTKLIIRDSLRRIEA